MVKFLRAVAFVLIAITAIATTRPLGAADTYAAEPRIHAIMLVDNGGRTETYETAARNVGAFLEEQGYELHPYDIVTPALSRRINNDNIIVRIERAFYLNVKVDGEETRMKVRAGTSPEDVLSTLQAELETALILDGGNEEKLNEETVLAFSTWRSEIDTVVAPIEYEVEFNTTPSLSRGVEKVRQEGRMGEHSRSYKVILVGNVEYNRELAAEVILEPRPRIVDRGIGGALGTLTDTSCPSFRYVRRVTMNASAYTSGFGCTGKHPCHPAYGITASGRRVQHGIVAVDPSVIPLGTRLYVEGYGFSIAADTGSAIRGYKIDLFMYDIADARRFGRRDITVFILD